MPQPAIDIDHHFRLGQIAITLHGDLVVPGHGTARQGLGQQEQP